MNIALKLEQERFVQRKIESGRYSSIDEVILEAFRLLEERDNHYEQWLQSTRQKIEAGISELDRGEGIASEVVIEKLREKFRKAREIDQ
jgi:antitoxin ParD1/3/4